MTQRRLLRHAARCSGFILDNRLDDDGKEWALHNFGDINSDQGRFYEAEKMYQRALAGYEKAWGPENTSTLSTVNLGVLYKSLRYIEDSEAPCEQY